MIVAREFKPFDTMPKQEVDLSEDVLTVLRQIIRATDMHSRKLARTTGLTTPQYVVLRAISDLGEVTMRTLSAQVSLSQATVTTIVDRLEKKGLVERYRSNQDRRIVHVRLCNLGKQILKKAPSVLQEKFADEFAELPDAQQQDFVMSLKKIATMMGADEIDASPVLTVAPPANDR